MLPLFNKPQLLLAVTFEFFVKTSFSTFDDKLGFVLSDWSMTGVDFFSTFDDKLGFVSFDWLMTGVDFFETLDLDNSFSGSCQSLLFLESHIWKEALIDNILNDFKVNRTSLLLKPKRNKQDLAVEEQ